MRLSFGRRESSAANTAYEPLKSPFIRHHGGVSRNTLDVTFATMCLVVLGLIGVSSLSFLAGRHGVLGNGTGDILNFQTAAQIFKYNQTYAERPDVASDKAWLDLFPEQGGFFKHPDLAPKRSTFAVFHQLHCLDSLRHGYWSLLDSALSGEKVNETDIHPSISHISHCIDLLRHALMCQPDLTVEVKDDKLDGATGFGTEHQCMDWNGLVKWTSEWESWKQDPVQDKEGKMDAKELEDNKLEGTGRSHRHGKGKDR
ncbi:hypothetical protein K504DRAFT_414493 [Pleomassaria siparia CBS 279.74]|uniref:Tat pathway signal sequence n=1 Tax=Pleomassaria siparia CBS 279.74 TaxID=1314801 RepID=A0A6G1JZ76_9PLEO|nr:hypothetical protein K504DRAFT_414493 [Pleomassaria siparia CBS 279.74]